MAQEKIPAARLNAVRQIGIVVRDLEKAIHFYSSVFGWGPFEVVEVEHKDYFYRGQRDSCRLKIALAQLGPIQIELVQPLEGATPHSDFLKERGEGVNHVNCGLVEDIDKVLTRLAEEGITPAYRARFEAPEATGDVVYLDSEMIGGLMLEIYQLNQRSSPHR